MHLEDAAKFNDHEQRKAMANMYAAGREIDFSRNAPSDGTGRRVSNQISSDTASDKPENADRTRRLQLLLDDVFKNF